MEREKNPYSFGDPAERIAVFDTLLIEEEVAVHGRTGSEVALLYPPSSTAERF